MSATTAVVVSCAPGGLPGLVRSLIHACIARGVANAVGGGGAGGVEPPSPPPQSAPRARHTAKSAAGRGLTLLAAPGLTIVDCPGGGAGSLARAIAAAGAGDVAVLVVDGHAQTLQPESAEALVLLDASPRVRSLVVVADMGAAWTGDGGEERARAALAPALRATRFGATAAVVPVAVPSDRDDGCAGLGPLVEALRAALAGPPPRGGPPPPPAPATGGFVLAIDRVFRPRAASSSGGGGGGGGGGAGAGGGGACLTVVTGLVVSGVVRAGAGVELGCARRAASVAGVQVRGAAVDTAGAGERVGVSFMCPVGAATARVLRGALGWPRDAVPLYTAALALVRRIRFHRSRAPQRRKFHIVCAAGGLACASAQATVVQILPAQYLLRALPRLPCESRTERVSKWYLTDPQCMYVHAPRTT